MTEEIQQVYSAIQTGDSERAVQLLQLGVEQHNVNKPVGEGEDVGEVYKVIDTGFTSLNLACVKGDVSVVEQLLSMEADVNVQTEDQTTPLLCACQDVVNNNKEIIVNLLIAHGADVTATDTNNWTALHYVCAKKPTLVAEKSSCLQITELLLKLQPDLHTVKAIWGGTSDTTALHMVAHHGQFELVSLLIGHGADVTATDKDNWTALHYVCYVEPTSVAEKSSAIKIVELVLKIQPDLHTVKATWEDTSDTTALHMAAHRGQFELVSLLIGHGADVTATDENNRTALHYVCEVEPTSVAEKSSRIKITELLLKLQPDLHTVKATWGGISDITALHLAAYHGQFELVSLLIGHGADVTATDKDSRTALHFVCNVKPTSVAEKSSRIKITELLLKIQPDLHTVKATWEDTSDTTALHLAASRGQFELVSLLIGHGADVTATDKDNWTALHYVCYVEPTSVAEKSSAIKIVELVLKIQPDLHTVKATWEDTSDTTALHMAAHCGLFELVRYLKHQGANLTAETDGKTPEHLALDYDHTETAKYLSDPEAMESKLTPILVLLTDVLVHLGDSAEFSILVNNPNLPVKWYNSSGQLHPSDHYSITSDERRHRLTIYDVTRRDVGLYRCMIASTSGATSICNLWLIDEHDRNTDMVFHYGHDSTKMIWTDIDKLALVDSKMMTILLAGDTFSGKTSLMRSILAESQCRTSEDQRTILAEFHCWMLKDKSYTFIDLGGQMAYAMTGPLFLSDSPSNLAIICHNIQSKNYEQTFLWTKSIINRSTKCKLLFILTKQDALSMDAVPTNLKLITLSELAKFNFIDEMDKLLSQEIESLDMCLKVYQHQGLKDSVSGKHQSLKSVKQRFEYIKKILPNKTIISSCFPGFQHTIGNVINNITITCQEEMGKILIPDLYKNVYVKIGNLGVQRTSLQKSSQNLAVRSDVEGIQSQFSSISMKQTQKQHIKHIKDSSNNSGNIGKKLQHPKSRNVKSNEKPQLTLHFSLSDIFEAVSPQVNIQAAEDLETDEREPNQTLGILSLSEVSKIYEDELKEFEKQFGHKFSGSVKDCLQCLHEHGLLVWFHGNPDIENIVFNDIATYIEILRCVFHHQFTKIVQFGSLTKDQKAVVFNDENILNEHLKKLESQGMISKSLARLRLLELKCHSEINAEFLFSLLEKLKLGYKVIPDASQEEYLMIPWFTENRSMPNFLKEKIPAMTELDTNQYFLVTEISGNIPESLFSYLCICISRYLFRHRAIQQHEIWKNFLWATIGATSILVQKKTNHISLIIKCPHKADSHRDVWTFMENIASDIDQLIEDWLPGLGVNFLVICSHCIFGQLKPPNKFAIEALLNAQGPAVFFCDKENDKELPSALLQPLPEDRAIGEERMGELCTYISRVKAKIKKQSHAIEGKVFKKENLEEKCNQTDVVIKNLSHHELTDQDLEESGTYHYLSYLGTGCTRLLLSNNYLTYIPYIAKWESLTELDLASNMISNIDVSLLPKKLKILNVSKNAFQYLPNLTAFVELQEIDVSENKITVIEGLPFSIQSIKLFDNPICTLSSQCFPRETTYKALKQSLTDDQVDTLQEPPSEVFSQGYGVLRNYLEKKELEAPEYKDIPANRITFTEDNKQNVILGQGGFARVFKGDYNGKVVAIKRIHESKQGLPQDKINELLMEASMMFKFRHENIHSVLGVVCDTRKPNNQLFCLITEFMDRGSLDNVMEKKKLSWPIKAKVMTGVANGLDYMYRSQKDRSILIVHGDIKASNILVDNNFTAKLSDFGICHISSITNQTGEYPNGTMTHMAPELFYIRDDEDDEVDDDGDESIIDNTPREKSDVWSFGITMFEVCAESKYNKHPFDRLPFPASMFLWQIPHFYNKLLDDNGTLITDGQRKKIPCSCPKFMFKIIEECCQTKSAERPEFHGVNKYLTEKFETECGDECILHIADLIQEEYDMGLLYSKK